MLKYKYRETSSNVTAVDDEMMLQVQTATVIGDVVVVEDELAYSA